MYLERLLQINMATLAALGALLLGMGQRSVGPPLVVAMAAAISLWATDIGGWFQLGRRTANLLMLAAAAVSLRQLFPLTNELQTLNFAWFLICLQAILFFQPKDERKYWLLVMFSLLQVIVATLFSQGVWFGVLLTVYMMLGFSAMSLLLMYREWEPQPPRETPQQKISELKLAIGQLVKPRTAAAGHGDVEGKPTVRMAAPTMRSGTCRPQASEGRIRWPLRGQESDFTGQPGGDDRAGIGGDLFGRLGRMALHTAVLTMVLFFAVPRLGQTTWRGVVGDPQTMVGYSDKVRLGELGEVVENPERVMQVRFFDRAHNNAQPITGEIYLQGAILMTYDEGQWQTGLPSWDVRTELLERPETMPADLVVQDIFIESLDHDELFYVAPLVPLKDTHEMSYDYSRQRLLRFEQLHARQFGYKLGTTAIVKGRQKPLTPSWHRDWIEHARQLPERDGVSTLPNLIALAKRWIDQSGLPESNLLGRARYLEQQLSTSTQFQYSLVPQPRDTDIDPIEDFVTKHSQGHCEYFATALTLMLRSQGIPARMVVGYKCDEWNAEGGYYQVRQLHAHTWVEAFLHYNEIPPDMLHGKDFWPWKKEGGWLRLDPTPGVAGTRRDASWFAPIRGAMDRVESLWSKYVVELDYESQRDAIYGPIAQAAKAVFNAVTDAERWRAGVGWLAALLCLDERSGVTAWQTVLTTVLIAGAALVCGVWLLWWGGRRLYALWTGNHLGRRRSRQAEIEFYRRCEAILAQHGLVRQTSQTQQEFAEAAGAGLVSATGRQELQSLPRVVVDAFYCVRFGRQPLDNLQVERVEHALAELAAVGKLGTNT